MSIEIYRPVFDPKKEDNVTKLLPRVKLTFFCAFTKKRAQLILTLDERDLRSIFFPEQARLIS